MNKEQIKIIKDRIDRGERYFKKENKDKFKRYLNYLKIKHKWSGSNKVGDKVSVPILHSIIRTKLPAVWMRNPKYLMKAKNPESVNNIQTAQTIMNYFPQEIGMFDEVKQSILDYIAFGRGVVRIGYEFDAEVEKTKDGEQDKIKVDKFYVNRISYPCGDIIYDPDAKQGLKDAKWVAYKIEDSLTRLQKNSLMNTKDLKSNITINGELIDNKKDFQETDDTKKVQYWEYWWKNDYGVVEKYCCIVPDQNLVMRTEKNPYFGEYPFEEVNNYEIPDYLFPLGDIQPLEDLQDEYDKMETMVLEYIKRILPKYKFKKGALDEKGKTSLANPEIGTSVEIKGELTDVDIMRNPAMANEIGYMTKNIADNITQISGVSEYQRASMPDVKRTLGEAKMVEGGSNQRSEDARQDIENFAKRIGRKLFLIIQQNLEPGDVFRITGNGAQASDWFKIEDKDQLQGEFDIDIEPHSTMPISQESERNDKVSLYKLVQQDQTIPPQGKLELLRNVLESFEEKNIDKIIPPVQPVNPMDYANGILNGQMPPVGALGPAGAPGAPGEMPPQGPPQQPPLM